MLNQLTPEEEHAVLCMPIKTLPSEKFQSRKYDLLLRSGDKQKFMGVMNRYLRDNSQDFPKIIHQTWFGPNKCPFEWIDTWRKDYLARFPDWIHMLWTEKEVEAFPMKLRGSYEREASFNGKSDVVRYEVLYRYGGVYIDADSIWLGTKNLEDLFHQCQKTGMFTGEEPNTHYPASGVVGAMPHHPALLLIMNAQRHNLRHSNDVNLPWITVGPLIFNVLENNGIPQTIFPSEYFYPVHWHNQRYTSINSRDRAKYQQTSYMFQFGYTTNQLNELVI